MTVDSPLAFRAVQTGCCTGQRRPDSEVSTCKQLTKALELKLPANVSHFFPIFESAVLLNNFLFELLSPPPCVKLQYCSLNLMMLQMQL